LFDTAPISGVSVQYADSNNVGISNMFFKDSSVSQEAIGTPQALHREAVLHLEQAIQHHQKALLLHGARENPEAEVHARNACSSTAHALEIGAWAVRITPQTVHVPFASSQNRS
jgi:hypothetical protein